MKFTFVIRGLKICSINNAYATKDGHKKKETHSWMNQIAIQMRTRREQIKAIQAMFDRKRHFLTIKYTWFCPQDRYFLAKSNQFYPGVNSRIGDWSNFPKIPDDLVLNTVLGIDDGFCKDGHVTILPWSGKTDNIMIEIQVLDIELLLKKAALVLPECLRGENAKKL